MNTSTRTDNTLDLSNAEGKKRTGRLPNIKLPSAQAPKAQLLSKTPQAPKSKHFTSPSTGEPRSQIPSRTQLNQPQQDKLDEPPRRDEESKKITTQSFDMKQQKFNGFIKEELMSLFSHPLNRYIFHNMMGAELDNEELREKLKELGSIPKFTHGKVIAPGEPYFRCLDCEIIKNTGQRTYLCRMCFEKKSHKGHRFLLFNDSTGNETCDCGNVALLDHRFFCPDHGNCTREDYDRVLDAVPNSFLANFNRTTKTVMYELIFACEVHIRNMQPNIKVALNKAVEAMISAFQQAISHNPLFLLLISEAITDKVAHPKSYKGFLFVEEKPAKNNNQIVEDTLSLTYLEALMRYSLLFRDETQKQLRELFLKLACVEEFKKRLVLSFHNVIHHLFRIRPQNVFNFSNIAHLTTQIYASEENCLNVIEKGSFLKLIEVLRQYGKFYEPTLDLGSQTLSRILHVFELILEKETPGRNFIQKGEVTSKFLDVLLDFQNAHTYDARTFTQQLKNPSSESNVIDYFNFEAKLLSINEKLMKNVGYVLDTEGWDHRPELFLIDWGERALQEVELMKQNPDHIRLNIPLQRAMISYLQCSLEKLDTAKVLPHLEYVKRSCPEAIEHLICQTLSTIGVMRRAMVQIDGWNIDSNKAVERYFVQDGLSFFDYDFAFVQLFSLLLSDEETDIFPLYYKNFFAKDDQMLRMFDEADFSTATEQQLLLVEDFLDFVVQVLHGEISFFNIFYKAPYLIDHGSKKTFDQIHRKILINFLHKSYQHFPITTLKQDFRYILRGDIFHEKILKDIADVEKASKNFKLKKAYNHLFDAYYLYTDRTINSKIIANVRANNSNPEIAELGNFSQSLNFLVSLQQIVYEGHIIEWCDKFFTKFSPRSAQLVPSVIKIIIMPLKLLEHNKKTPVTKKIKQNVVFPLFGSKDFLEKIKKVLPQIDNALTASPLAKLINIFIPTSNIGSTIVASSVFDQDNSKTFLDPNMSMDPNIVHESLLQMQQVQQVSVLDEKDLSCGVCRKLVDLTGTDVGIPAYISRSNVNFWELKGRKFRKPFQQGDEETLRLILGLLKRYSPYAGGLHPKDVDFLDDGVPINYLLDFYPALTSCMHYMHRTCFTTSHVPITENSHEYECPVCKKLNNMFIGLEKVDAASRKLIEEQLKKNKKFMDFLRKQAVSVPMLPDSTLKFDFYNSFMHGMFPKNPHLELKPADPSADKKILKFVNLIRASFFQLVRNSLINDFQTFMGRSYLCYKFAFVNLQSFIMKNWQFHQFFENFDKELSPTIFHILNHKGLMQSDGPPSMQQIYDTFKEPLGLEQVKRQMKRKEDRAKKLAEIAASKHSGNHHEHTKKLPELPPIFKGNRQQESMIEMNKKNKDIMMAYNYKNHTVKMGELMYDDGIGSYGSLPSSRNNIDPFNLNGTHDSIGETGRGVGSVPDVDDGPKEEELFDLLQKMMLLFENETEEDFMLAFWETFLKFIVTNRMKDFHSNLDLTMLPIDFLYLRTLNIIGRTMISEKIIKQRQTNLPEFDEICEIIAGDEGLRASFIEEMIGLTQRIIVACILIFDFDKCLEISNTLDFLSELQGNREGFLNALLGLLHKDLTVNMILSLKFWDLSHVYKNFFYAWRENLRDFMSKTRNPFELFSKNVVEIKPLIVELPSNFNEFNSEYLPRKCDKCKEFCDYCRTVLCLLCGKVMCKDKCGKKTKKPKRIDINQSIDTQDTNTDTESILNSTSLEPPSHRGSPPVGLSKFSNKNANSNAIRITGSTARLKTMVDRTDRSKEIMTFDDNLGEASPSKGGALSSVFRPNDFQTPKRAAGLIPARGHASDNPRINVHAAPGQLSSEKKTTAKGSPKDFMLKSKGKAKTADKRAMSLASKRLKSRNQLDMSALTDSVVDTSVGDGTSKKKRKKRRRRNNMTKHADECHKGHTVFIDIQEQSVILFSKPREVVYPEKLYVDRFGQELKDKVNITEEDWNFFEVNPFVLKKLREAVENHSLPQLIYLIIKNHYKAKSSVL